MIDSTLATRQGRRALARKAQAQTVSQEKQVTIAARHTKTTISQLERQRRAIYAEAGLTPYPRGG